MKATEFITYKQHLVHYLEEFIQDLQDSAAQIGAQIDAFSEVQVDRILERVHQSALDIPRRPLNKHLCGKKISDKRSAVSGFLSRHGSSERTLPQGRSWMSQTK